MATQTTTANIFASTRPQLTTSSAPPPKPVQRTRSYKEFLTPALHRRFFRAATIVFLLCFNESYIISPSNILWIWNPVSFQVARTLLLSTTCLAVFILRVANMRVGMRDSSSTAAAVYDALAGKRKWETVQTLGWYIFSACFFGEIYIWSRGQEGNLGWMDPGQEYERPRVNENPVFLRALYFCLAVVQSGLHLRRDEDKVVLPLPEAKEEVKQSHQQDQEPKKEPIAPSSSAWLLQQLTERAPTMVRRVLTIFIPTFALVLASYLISLRFILWPYFYTIVRTFFNPTLDPDLRLPPRSRPSGFNNGFQLFGQSVFSSILLILLWEFSNAVFTIFVAQPPMKGEVVLTSDSNDANGSLLGGLRSKKEVSKAFAFWELWMICEKFDTRRKTIYTEVDRAGGSTWKQIEACCLAEVQGISTRIVEATAPPAPPPQAQQLTAQPQEQGSLSMPRIADRRVIENGDVFAAGGRPSSHGFGNMAKSMGQAPGAANPVAPQARKAIEWGTDRLLTKNEQQKLLTYPGLEKEATGTLEKVIASPVGEPFRQTFTRKIRLVIFGESGIKENIIHAALSLSKLCAQSLKEDDYGQVAPSIPAIMRAYTTAIMAIQQFLATAKPDWTDVNFAESDRRKDQDVEQVLAVLKQGLEAILLAFSEYASGIGVSLKELREAREAVGKGQEMKEVR